MVSSKTTPNTQGFYNEDLQYAPNSVFFPDGTSITKEDYKKYNYPVNGWNWYDSIEAAYASQGKTPPILNTKMSKTLITKDFNQIINK